MFTDVPHLQSASLTRKQCRYERQLNIAQRLQFWAAVVAVSYIAVVGFLFFG